MGWGVLGAGICRIFSPLGWGTGTQIHLLVQIFFCVGTSQTWKEEEQNTQAGDRKSLLEHRGSSRF